MKWSYFQKCVMALNYHYISNRGEVYNFESFIEIKNGRKASNIFLGRWSLNFYDKLSAYMAGILGVRTTPLL